MIFMKAEIVARHGHAGELLELLTTRLFPLIETLGSWRLQGCFLQQTGQLGTIVDLWSMDDHTDFAATLDKMRAHPVYADVSPVLARCVESETLVLMEARAGALRPAD